MLRSSCFAPWRRTYDLHSETSCDDLLWTAQFAKMPNKTKTPKSHPPTSLDSTPKCLTADLAISEPGNPDSFLLRTVRASSVSLCQPMTHSTVRHSLVLGGWAEPARFTWETATKTQPHLTRIFSNISAKTVADILDLDPQNAGCPKGFRFQSSWGSLQNNSQARLFF